MFTINPGMRLCAVGTSLTAGGSATGQPRGWWPDVFGIGGMLNTGQGYSKLTNPSGGAGAALALHPASVNPPVAVHFPTLAEIGGAKLADLIAAWGTLVTPYEPIDAFVMEGNINDVNAATNTTTFSNQMDTLLGLTGSRPVIWMGALLGFLGNGENDTLFGDAFNLSIDSYNAIVAARCAAAGSRVTYMDLRPTFKAWETANNTGHAGVFRLTTDGVHLTEEGIGVAKIAARAFTTWA